MWQHLAQTRKPIVLYGMGNGADKIIAQLEARNIPLRGVFASDGFVRAQTFHGFTVTSYDDAVRRFGDMVVLVAFGTHRADVMENIRRIARSQELYAPDLPVYGDGIFDRAYAEAHRAELSAVRGRLCDDLSRRVFDEVLAYKLSGDISHLLRAESPQDEAYDLLDLGSDETYLDLGAYTGDTVREFLAHVPSYRAIHAVEPDASAFRRLCKNTEGLHDCSLYRVGIHSERAQLPFLRNAGRGSSVASAGALMEMDSVDGLLGGSDVSYIKIDVEGQESAALLGARQTILRCKPKLLLSAYHRTEDLFALPLQVLSLRSDYKLYLRHHPAIPAWDVNYYMV